MESSGEGIELEDIGGSDTVIVGVAIKTNGVVCALPKPARHHHIIKILSEVYKDWNDYCVQEQGFVAGSGRYMDRKQAKNYAVMIGQIKEEEMISSTLTSEDLW